LEKIIIGGGNRLCGEVLISGAKNAALPIMAASLLASTTSTLNNIPRLTDISTMIDVLNEFSVKVITTGNRLVVSPENFALSLVPYELMKKMRASVLVVGPLLARFGSAKVSLPGGCAIGSRPIDLHIKGFQALGAEVSMEHGYIHVWADKLYGGRIYLDIPSVGATENIMMAASLADGRTIIENVAEEPEIVDLANFLNSMGACIKGAGTNIIEIEGVESLHGVEYTIIPDRIEAGTYAVVAAISKELVGYFQQVFLMYEEEIGILSRLRLDSGIIKTNNNPRTFDSGKSGLYLDVPYLLRDVLEKIPASGGIL
jgi:UDP-N-acetylglucosamine 1-carboxyvinyltransferase